MLIKKDGVTVRLGQRKFLERVATFCANNGITSDAQLDTAIDALTDAQLRAATRVFLKALVEIIPAGTTPSDF